jgi:7-carboxy-7-deazaguanine synthase
MSKIPVMEIFGPTIQGEGAVIGTKTMFVRTAGCDYRCVWCDSAFTWDGSAKSEMRLMEPAEIVDELLRMAEGNFSYVTISGGNPALIGSPMKTLIELLHEKGIKVGMETQGSVYQEWFSLLDQITVSPKPPSSHMTPDLDKLDRILQTLQPDKASLKVVVFDEDDFRFAKSIHRRYPRFAFYVQPGNDDVNEPGDISKRLLTRLEWLFEKVMGDPDMNEVKVLPQLHALVWHNKRGK